MKFNWKKLLSIIVPVLVEIALPKLGDLLDKTNNDPNDPISIAKPSDSIQGPRQVPWWEDRP